MMEVGTSSFSDDEIVQRLLRAEYDRLVFEALVHIGLWEHNARELSRSYKSTRSRNDRLDMLLEQADRLRRSRLEAYAGRKTDDILVETITNTIGPFPRIRDKIFGHSNSERDLYPVIGKYLRRLKRDGDIDEIHATYDRKDLPAGNPDFICLRRRTLRSDEVTAIDAKATSASLHDFYSQASKYQKGGDRVFLAVTRWVAIQEGEERLRELPKELGAGLITVDLNAGECDTLTASSSDGARDKEMKQRLLRALA